MHLSRKFYSSLFVLAALLTIPAGGLRAANASEPDFLQQRTAQAELLFIDGQFEHENGDYAAALSLYDRALSLDPTHIKAYASRAGVLGAMENYSGAIADYTAAIKLNPTMAGAYGGRGFAHYLNGNNVEAAKDLSRAAEMFEEEGDMQSYFGTLELLESISISS